MNKYGDSIVEGMILNDFEPVVDEIVNEKIWYNSIDKKLKVYWSKGHAFKAENLGRM